MRFPCQHCAQRIEADEALRGLLVQCPACGADTEAPQQPLTMPLHLAAHRVPSSHQPRPHHAPRAPQQSTRARKKTPLLGGVDVTLLQITGIALILWSPLGLAGLAGLILIIIGQCRVVRHCSACGNTVARTSKLCPTCGASFARHR